MEYPANIPSAPPFLISDLENSDLFQVYQSKSRLPHSTQKDLKEVAANSAEVLKILLERAHTNFGSVASSNAVQDDSQSLFWEGKSSQLDENENRRAEFSPLSINQGKNGGLSSNIRDSELQKAAFSTADSAIYEK